MSRSLRKWVKICNWLTTWITCDILQYLDAVGWVFWPVKPTTESENRLQLDSLSTSVNIHRLTVVDNTSAVGNDSRPWVVPQSIKWLSTITRERWIPPDSESGGIPHLFGTSVPPYRQCLTDSSWQQQQQQAEWCSWHDVDTTAVYSGRLAAQVSWLRSQVGRWPALFCIHQVNRVNSCNGCAMITAWFC